MSRHDTARRGRTRPRAAAVFWWPSKRRPRVSASLWLRFPTTRRSRNSGSRFSRRSRPGERRRPTPSTSSRRPRTALACRQPEARGAPRPDRPFQPAWAKVLRRHAAIGGRALRRSGPPPRVRRFRSRRTPAPIRKARGPRFRDISPRSRTCPLPPRVKPGRASPRRLRPKGRRHARPKGLPARHPTLPRPAKALPSWRRRASRRLRWPARKGWSRQGCRSRAWRRVRTRPMLRPEPRRIGSPRIFPRRSRDPGLGGRTKRDRDHIPAPIRASPAPESRRSAEFRRTPRRQCRRAGRMMEQGRAAVLRHLRIASVRRRDHPPSRRPLRRRRPRRRGSGESRCRRPGGSSLGEAPLRRPARPRAARSRPVSSRDSSLTGQTPLRPPMPAPRGKRKIPRPYRMPRRRDWRNSSRARSSERPPTDTAISPCGSIRPSWERSMCASS